MTALGDPAPRPPTLGRYELITQIGHGGMAEVQLALQRGPAGFEKLVVVKLVHATLASQKAFVDMLLDEARVAALVKHPNVVDIYDLGEAEGRYFIAMEYLEGEPLLAVLRAGRDGRRLDVLSTARLIADTAEGLDAAHELRSMAGDPIELVHHDVSLGNIVVLYNGQVKLVDFGVAKASQSATARAKVQGKFAYMAPEKLRGEPGDRRSDIWSLGCVLWEALTLRRLFKGGNDSDTMLQVLESSIPAPSEVNGDVPVDFDAIVLRALDRDPARRYATAKAMAAEIEEVLRKHGYAAKNDMIARYMQATFESHITARKKLLQEVSSKGRASPDVVEAAFHHEDAIAPRSKTLSSGDLTPLRNPPDATPANIPAMPAALAPPAPAPASPVVPAPAAIPPALTTRPSPSIPMPPILAALDAGGPDATTSDGAALGTDASASGPTTVSDGLALDASASDTVITAADPVLGASDSALMASDPSASDTVLTIPGDPQPRMAPRALLRTEPTAIPRVPASAGPPGPPRALPTTTPRPASIALPRVTPAAISSQSPARVPTSRPFPRVPIEPPRATTDERASSTPPPSSAQAGEGDELTDIEPQPVKRNRRWLVYPAAAGILVAAVIVTSLVFGGNDNPGASELPLERRPIAAGGGEAAQVAPAPAAERPVAGAPLAANQDPDPEPPRADPIVPPPVIANPPAPGPVPPASDPDSTSSRSRPAPPRHPPPHVAPAKSPPDKINPGEVFKTGLQAWVRGDTKTALTSYKRVLQSNPDYAPAWRGVGLVYEKLGDKPAAHVAFQKYLQLAPGAFDAAGIRARLESP